MDLRVVVKLRTDPRVGEPLRRVIFRVRYEDYRPAELVELPEGEAHRLAWLGIVEPVGFRADATRGQVEHQLRGAEGE